LDRFVDTGNRKKAAVIIGELLRRREESKSVELALIRTLGTFTGGLSDVGKVAVEKYKRMMHGLFTMISGHKKA
jgi:hypothetical protein